MDRRTFFGLVAALAVGSQVKATPQVIEEVRFGATYAYTKVNGEWHMTALLNPAAWDYLYKDGTGVTYANAGHFDV
jgi:hypothetical protein